MRGAERILTCASALSTEVAHAPDFIAPTVATSMYATRRSSRCEIATNLYGSQPEGGSQILANPSGHADPRKESRLPP